MGTVAPQTPSVIKAPSAFVNSTVFAAAPMASLHQAPLAPPAAPPPAVLLAAGTTVVIEGLTKLPTFNGLCGVVQCLDEKTGRYSLLLDSSAAPGGHQWAKVKSENL